MTTTSSDPPWVMKKAVLVSIPNSEIACSARLRIFHDINTNKGSISLKIRADLANLRGILQDLTLSILPERVEECALSLTNNDGLFPPGLVPMLPASVQDIRAVSTLSLRLGTTGIVLCPHRMEYLSPANPEDKKFYAFAKICQSKSLRLHFSTRQFVDDEPDRLKTFSLALNRKDFEAECFKRPPPGVVERNWTVFSLSPDPPPYDEAEQVKQVDPPLYSGGSKPEQVIRKRCRDQRTMSPDRNRRRKRLLSSPQPPGSATEVDTPSTCSSSPSSIRPTYFTRAFSPGCADRNKLAHLEHQLRGVSDHLICKLLIRTGRRHLLARPEEVDSDLPSNSEKVSFAKAEPPLKQYIDEMIERCLTPVVNKIVDSAVSDGRDQITDGCKITEAEFREQVDDYNSEVRMTADECMKEMQEQAQRYMDKIEEQAQWYMDKTEEQAQECMDNIENQRSEVEMSMEEKVAKFERWFNASAPSLLDGKSSPTHELGTDARRCSI